VGIRGYRSFYNFRKSFGLGCFSEMKIFLKEFSIFVLYLLFMLVFIIGGTIFSLWFDPHLKG